MLRSALFILSLLCAPVAPTWADEWPSKPIRAIVPFGPGSAGDIVPRLVFEQLTAELGQPIVVENRVGAGGTIGTGIVAKAEPDGYTILAHSSAHTISPALYSNLSYDTANDFIAVGVIGNVPNVLIVSPSKGLKTVQEFVAAAKAKPGSFNFASVGVGTAVHLSAERFRISAGYDAVHIPFKGGAEALTEVIAGRVDYYFCPIATALPHIKEGRLLGLAVSSPQRASALPDVPTTLEAGFPNSDFMFWIGVLAPAKTSPQVVAKLNGALQKVMQSPALKARLAVLGVEPMALTPVQFDSQIRREIVTYGQFAKAAGLKPN